MALSLIPPTQQKKSKIKKAKIGALALKKAKDPQKLIYISIFIVGVILIFAFYWTVKHYRSLLKDKIQELTQEEDDLKAEKIELRKKSAVTEFQAKLDALESIVDSHVNWKGVLETIENLTLPKVKYNSFDSDSSERSIRLSGFTANFTSLAEQMVIFKNNPDLIESFKLESFKMSENGIDFSLEIILFKEAWEEGVKKNES